MAHKNIRIHKPTLFIGVFLITTISVFFSCENFLGSNSKHDAQYITKFDMDEMAKKNLADFALIRSRAQWNRGREFVFQRSSDQANVFIIIGIHQSPGDANDIALDYLNEISIRMKEGPLAGAAIGDKLWWWSPNSDSTNVTNILFLKENVLFILSSHSYKNLIDLARAIAEDITKKESYLTIEESLSVPKVNSVSLTKSSVKDGDSTKITIHATDTNNELLEYQAQPGLIRFQSDPENVFTFVASRDQVSEPFFGSHKIKFVVINESNVVSGIAEITVNITP